MPKEGKHLCRKERGIIKGGGRLLKGGVQKLPCTLCTCIYANWLN